jgi:AbiV family abortive infection protein
MQSENTHTRETAPIAAVISNVERLIKDAELLLSDGSSCSSMSLAILAFEEAGKGLIIKMGIEQPASVRSRHEFRHAISLIMLTIALTQKYGVDIVDTTVKLQARLGKEITKKNGRIIIPIITNSLKDEIARDLKPSIEKISPDNITFLHIEFRWLKHIGE